MRRKSLGAGLVLVTLSVGAAFLAGSCTTTKKSNTATATAQATNTYTSTPVPTSTPTKTNTPSAWIYIWGGDQGSTNLTTVYSAGIVGPGMLGPWTASSPMPTAISNLAYTSDNSYVFAIGGNNPTVVNSVWYAPYGSGSVGPWAQASPLPNAVQLAGAAVVNGQLWVYGGVGSAAFTTVFASTLTAGLPTTWSTATHPLPTPANAGFWGGDGSYLYEAGGSQTTGNSFVTSSFGSMAGASAVNTSWTAGGALATPVAYGGYAVFSGYFYGVAGSTTGANTVATVQQASASGGTVGTWATSQPIPVGAFQPAVIGYGSYLYVVGGVAATGTTSHVYAGLIGSGGAISAWSTLTDLPSGQFIEAEGIAVK